MSNKKKNEPTLDELREEKKKAYLKAKSEESETITLEIHGFTCELTRPNRALYERVVGLITPIPGRPLEIIKAGSIILNTCWVKGDKEIKEFDDLYTSICTHCVSLVRLTEVELKKS